MTPDNPTRDPECGVILINVLVILALSSTVLFAMLRLADTAITRSQQFADAGQGTALILGAEATAIAALRRDPPKVDHLAEPWVQIAQQNIAIDGGTFSLAITDAQGRFNLNNLRRGAPEDLQILQRIITALDVPDAIGLRILARMADLTPLAALPELAQAGIGPDDLQRLSTLVTVLPNPTPININTMPDAMFAVLAGNPVQARLLQGIRTRNGQLTQADLLNAGLILTTQAGMQSSYFTITTRVTIGTTTQARDSLLYRFTTPGNGTQVIVTARTTVP